MNFLNTRYICFLFVLTFQVEGIFVFLTERLTTDTKYALLRFVL